MNSKLLIVSVLFVFLFIFGIGMVSGVECNNSAQDVNGAFIINSSSISDGCVLDDAGVSYIMSGENFQLNGSVNGAVAIGANNLSLNCNNSIIYGNYSDNPSIDIRGIRSQSRNNLTLINCNIRNFRTGYNIQSGTGALLLNVSVNSSNQGISLGGFNETTIVGGIFSSIGNRMITIGDGSNNLSGLYIHNLTVNSYTGSESAVYIRNVKNVLINNLTINSSSYATTSSYGIFIFNNNFIDNSNITLINNKFLNMSSHCMAIESNTRGINIINSSCETSYGKGIDFYTNASNILVKGNYIINANISAITFNQEQGGRNSTSENNIIINSTTSGLNSFFAIIVNSFNDFIDGTADAIASYSSQDMLFINSTIRNSNSGIRLSSGSNNATIIGLNVTNTNITVWIENATNVIIKDSLQNSNIVHYFKLDILENVTFSNVLGYSLFTYNFSGNRINISNSYMYIASASSSVNSMNFFNLTNSLVYNTNGSIYGNSNINLNDGNINITLTPNNSSYVLDNFNLTEGISRQHSPIWFSSSSSTQKHIASNLSESVNVQVLFNVDNCDTIGNIYYTPNGQARQLYQRGSYSCSNNQVTFTSLQIEPSAESNEIEIEYGCGALTNTGFSLIMIFFALAIVSLIIYVGYQGIYGEGITVEQVVITFIVVIVGVIMWQVAGQNLGSACPVT